MCGFWLISLDFSGIRSACRIFCFRIEVSSLLSAASLIVATAELSVTKLLTQAMRTADLASRPGPPSPFDRPVPAAINDLRCYSQNCHRDDCCRPSNRPSCTYTVIKSSPPIIYRPARPALQAYVPRAAELHAPLSVSPTESPIQPPWKVLPWENPPQPPQTVKIHCHPTDVMQKGMLLDLFV
jgi:hypothetical protein